MLDQIRHRRKVIVLIANPTTAAARSPGRKRGVANKHLVPLAKRFMITQITHYLHAQTLFGIAKRASFRRHNDAPIIAVIFSATALEAFINDSIALADMVPTAEKQDIVVAYATVMKELEDRREALLIKYHIGLIIWSGSAWSEQLPPYQDFRLLLSLRNSLLHMRSDRWEVHLTRGSREPKRTSEQYPRFINAFRQRKLIESPSKSKSWLEIVNTPTIGKWACRTASEITKLFVERIPAGYYKTRLEEQVLHYA